MVYQEATRGLSTPEQGVPEIERKWLVLNLPADLDTYPSVEIKQGYVVIEPSGTEVRLRQKGDKYFVTVKSVGDLVRSESEVEISKERFDAVWPMASGISLEKTRTSIPYGKYTIEVDRYKGKLNGLVTAEVEFESVEESEVFEAPSWIGDDVTKDKRYKNQQLALHGIPSSQS